MQTLQISDQAAQQLNDLAAQEHISGSDLIERLIKKYTQELAKQPNDDDFFSCAGIWKDSDINQEAIRSKAWKQVNHDSV